LIHHPSRPLSRTHRNYHGHYYCQYTGIACELTVTVAAHWNYYPFVSVTISYLILVIMPSLPFEKLNETNYDDWKIQMEALLEEKGLFGVVNG